VRNAEQALHDSESLVKIKYEELEAYRIWRKEEEERRYDHIMNTAMSIQQLDHFKSSLAVLADREKTKEEDVFKAQKETERCRIALDNAIAAARQAQKNTSKIQVHKDLWSEESKKEAEHQEDLELEEFRPLSRKGAEAESEDI
jgi:type III secretion protein O